MIAPFRKPIGMPRALWMSMEKSLSPKALRKAANESNGTRSVYEKIRTTQGVLMKRYCTPNKK